MLFILDALELIYCVLYTALFILLLHDQLNYSRFSQVDIPKSGPIFPVLPSETEPIRPVLPSDVIANKLIDSVLEKRIE